MEDPRAGGSARALGGNADKPSLPTRLMFGIPSSCWTVLDDAYGLGGNPSVVVVCWFSQGVARLFRSYAALAFTLLASL